MKGLSSLASTTIPSTTRCPATTKALSQTTNIAPKNTEQISTIGSLNPTFNKVQYAIRGELAIKAETLRDQLKEGKHGLPFDKVISSNIGSPQQKGLDQKPLTFPRQVAALLEYPELAKLAPNAFPKDVVARAEELSKEIGSIGAYSHSQGIPFIRKNVAKFIENRDGYPANPNHIFLTAGASAGVNLLINMLISHPNDGILIPIPQYPLYTAALAQHRGVPLPYYLDEKSGWSTSSDDIEKALAKAKEDGVTPRALVIINPGNPTGALLNEEDQRKIVQLCEQHKIVLLADEVYQNNIHQKQYSFTSFKKVVRSLQSPVPLFSFHSISKGVSGECENISEDILALIYKMVSVGLCPPVQGQVGVDTMVRPPQPGEESYQQWKSETDSIHTALATRTHTMATRLSQLPGVSCVDSPGAMYLFPKITLSEKAIQEAKERGKEPDAMYALELLDKTGICVVPGSGFGQREGEWHYRLTCLCPGVDEYVGKLENFHKEWVEKYGV